MPDSKMDAHTPLAGAGKVIASHQIKRLVKFEPGAKAGEVEAVHQMRVATRRLRSLLGALEMIYPKRACKAQRKGLRRLARALGEARNLDVIAALVQASAPNSKSSERMRATLMERKEEALTGVRARLAESSHQELLEGLESLFTQRAEAPSPRLAEALPVMIWERYAALRAFEPDLAHLSVERLHDLRIEGKRLRYVLEFFEEPLGKEQTRGLIAKLVTVQDAIGEMHDAELALDESLGLGEAKALAKGLRKHAEAHREAALQLAPALFASEFKTELAMRCAAL